MKTNTIKTMQHILSDVQEFCHDNIDKLYQHSINVHRYIDDTISIEVVIVERYAEPLEEHKFSFKSNDHEYLIESSFDKFREYINDYYSRNK